MVRNFFDQRKCMNWRTGARRSAILRPLVRHTFRIENFDAHCRRFWRNHFGENHFAQALPRHCSASMGALHKLQVHAASALAAV